MRRTQALLGFLFFLSGCANTSPISNDFEVGVWNVSSRECMPYVHSAREEEIPQPVLFMKDVSETLFSCEYFRGVPLRYFGSAGPKLKVEGRQIYADFGYAIASNDKALAEFVSATNFASYYVFLPKGISIRTERRTIAVDGKPIPTYFVYASSPLFGEKMLSAMSVVDFSQDNRSYRLFLWAQDFPLSEGKIIDRFGRMKSLVIAPRTRSASRE